MRKLLNQTYTNIEIILVENFSSDNSKEICKRLSKDKRVFYSECDIKATSQARKKGVTLAKGKYIVFSDQDDSYKNKYCIEKMVRAIEEDQTQIVQFNRYISLYGIYKKEKCYVLEQRKYNREEILNEYIGGVIGVNDLSFRPAVWDKIYSSELLKSAVENINQELYFAEDMFLNFCVFTNSNLISVSTRKESYYCWKKGIGFSSSKDSGKALMKDYNQVKPLISKKLTEIGTSDEVVFKFNLETVYFYKVHIKYMIDSGIDKKDVIDTIKWLNELEFVINAKKYFSDYADKSKIWDELRCLSEINEPEKMYDYILSF